MERRKTFNVEFQHHIASGPRQDIVWGANYSVTDSDTHGDLSFSLNPADVNMQLFSLFIEDEIALVRDKLFLTVGARLDHNYYTGFNILPGTQISWTPNQRQMLWASISQANRTPAETDAGSRINVAGFPGPGGTPTLSALVGNPHFNDEALTAYQTGWRTTLREISRSTSRLITTPIILRKRSNRPRPSSRLRPLLLTWFCRSPTKI